MTSTVAHSTTSPLNVVFICEHGAAKSVVAAAWLRREAAHAGLSLRAEARGTAPADALSAAAVSGLLSDRFGPDESVPQRLRAADVATAWRVVVFGPEVTSEVAGAAPVETWTVPAVIEGYAAARDAIVERLAPLLRDAAVSLARERGGVHA